MKQESCRAGQVAAAAAVMLLVTRTFQYFPGFSVIQELSFVVSPLVLGWIWLSRPDLVGRWPRYEKYAVILVVITPIWSGFAAANALGQPMVYGVLAWRASSLIAATLVLLYAVRAGWIRTLELERALIVCAWATTGLYVLMRGLLNPADFMQYGIGFVEDRMDEGIRFKFGAFFQIHAMLHYGVRGFREKRLAWYGVSIFFFAFLFGSAGGRGFAMAVLLTALLLMARWGGLRSLATGAAGIALVTVLGFGASYILAPDATAERISKFGDAFELLTLEPESIGDASAAARGLQTIVALSMIADHPWIGHGRLSGQWAENGFESLWGVYFIPDDIGVIGMLFQFGVLGVCLYALQFGFAWRCASRLSQGARHVAADAVAAHLLFIAVSSVLSGAFVMFAEASMLLITVFAARAEQAAPGRSARHVRHARKLGPA